MATPRRKLLALLIISTILLQFVVEFCDAGRSSRISTSRRMSTRRYSRTSLTRSTLRTKYGQSISSTRSKISRIGWKHALLAGGLLYIGSQMYMSRRMYYSHPSRTPTICSNYVDADENGTVYKMFICPRHYESDNQVHCCGPEGQQRCCAATKTTGGVVGIVIGVIITVAIIAGVIYCVCRNKKQRGHVIDKDGEGQEVIMGPPPVVIPPPGPMGYGPHPGMMPPPVMDPNQAQYPMNYGSTYGQPSCPPPPPGYPYPAPPPGQPVPGSIPPPYAQPIPSAPNMMPPGVQPGMPPQQPPPPPGFYTQGPPPPHPPPPYTMP
ncbi:uncharacterized protein LOC106867966 isoform X2 [Octopus bimaculoides]|uniref:uncharacterized protein LOC106867966 isoform X2 n=1 Tax=Octopus bimaculoides TaxID=37653 RepID=UPI00071DB95D|nr:uncharacterized protein LOC106867966 isoform X2 [Octopus bimaculoides]|eukprot:XP_014768566.1 PREDICTED: subtilisin-like protease 1 isoform X1 [Octopus bimaculoides]